MNFKGFTKKQLFDVYYNMALSRYLDDKQLILLKQGKGFFHIGGSGHAAAGMAAALIFKQEFSGSSILLGVGYGQQRSFISIFSEAG